MIELTNVSYQYPHTVQPALNRISLSLNKGRCIMVTGPSGAGQNFPLPCGIRDPAP